jgi:type II secretory pathway component PulJ
MQRLVAPWFPRKRVRRGFTLVEMFVASVLTVFLCVLLSSIWVWLNKAGFPNDVLARGLLMQEINLTVAALSHDLNGSEALASSYHTTADSGTVSTAINAGRWIGWQTGGDDLSLCYDGGNNPDGSCNWTGTTDTVVHYYLQKSSNALAADAGYHVLVREKTENNVVTKFVVAKNLSGMAVQSDGADPNFIQIVLTFTFQRHSNVAYFGDIYTRTLTLEARKPQ